MERDFQIEYPIDIQKSLRKTVSISITEDLRIRIKAPSFMADRDIRAMTQKYRPWIEKHIAMQEKKNRNARSFSPEEVALLKEKAALFVRDRVMYYSAKMGAVPAGVKITSAAGRWGSCSGKNRLCFSYRIALLPPEAADYVVVHELAHIRQKNHGPHFYEEVQKILPDYRRRISLLKQAQEDLGL